ncbi:linoleate 13S-lipoxygenase 3-1, chloroplastic-like [Corylus avellana]|uniref:linoleate 13S-lipoxygenase 3-1, chloroplastic-like n=1 Tax=Corylus avellana TaxID=13451 RepID=UPI00286C4A01|nr:linoleate 13S-lipoxygenase 3-1, chloroplastic-like [Corylus avellana]
MEMMPPLFDALVNPSQKGAVVLQLVSTEIDPRRMEPKMSKEAILDWSNKKLATGDERSTYKVEFMVDSDFGVPGAITVVNKYQKEFFLESINIEGVVQFVCNSWVQAEKVNANKRIFFSNKAYLPQETPVGLKELREEELRELRGDGKGLKIPFDRVYDYDVYNDLGDPDKGIEHVRPTLGGKNNPHPRRCRTGRPPTSIDINAESRPHASTEIYVPRDEALEKSKRDAFNLGKLKGILRNIIPSLTVTDSDHLKDFSDLNSIYKGRSQDGGDQKKRSFQNILSRLQDSVEEFFKFDPPHIISRDTSCWLRDDEFSRQALAGINPLSIEKLKVFPPISKLDPSIYGAQESALREEHIEGHLNGMSVQKAMEKNKLFILDYHDMYLPFLNQINNLEDRKAYATRTIFFLTSLGTLKPIAIELSLPPMDPNSPSKQVLVPPVDATTNWLWQLGKAHVCSNDSGVHQLVHHWLGTHACMEPFIIAAHRQLSVMHPIFKLLDPHMRYTLKINAMARETLINAGGIIETNFTPGKYCMQISCAAYRDWWRFDLQSLPADLIRRGVAIPDRTQPHGLRLLIEDYPYATDGLLIWSAIQTMVRSYVNYYYQDASAVCSDTELQVWYNESINVGHADLRHASWWPNLSTPDDLTSILTTIIWLASAQHAALNFGQYPYGGYVPTRPPLMRRLIPKENDPEYASFVKDPEGFFLSSLPSWSETTKYMAVIDIISSHSPDEEYLGVRTDLSTWLGEAEIIEAFYRFSMEIRKIEKEIEKRNSDINLRNRCGAGITPYELLIPSSGPGVTCRGVPNSITV